MEVLPGLAVVRGSGTTVAGGAPSLDRPAEGADRVRVSKSDINAYPLI
jgi:hypothetical protein